MNKFLGLMAAEGFSQETLDALVELSILGIPPIAGGDGTIVSPRSTGVDMDTSTNLEYGLRIRDLSGAFDAMSDYDVFVQKMIGGDAFETRNVKHEWGEDDLWGRRFVIRTALADGAGVTVDVPVGTAHRYPKGSLIKIQDEILWVSAMASADSLTVVRGASGTTGAAHTIPNGEAMVVGNAIAEGETRVLRGTPVSATKFNYCQISRQAVGVTFRQNDALVYGRTGQDLPDKMALVLKQLAVGLDEDILEGQRYAGTAAADPGTFGGLDYFFNTAVDANANVVDLANAAITEKTVLDLLQAEFYKIGSNMATLLLVDAWTKRKFNSFWQPGIRQSRSENTIGVVIDKMATDFGEVQVFMHQGVPKGKAYFINPAFIKLGHYGSRGKWNSRPLPVTNDTVEEEVYGDYTLEVRNAVAQGKIKGISQTA